jgi:hypothetical protein
MSLKCLESGKKRLYTERIQEELIVACFKIFCWNLFEEASGVTVGMREDLNLNVTESSYSFINMRVSLIGMDIKHAITLHVL